jgi:hypothetical protein
MPEVSGTQKYSVRGTGGTEQRGSTTFISMDLYDPETNTVLLRAKTPIGNFKEHGLIRCGNPSRCPVKKNMGILGNTPPILEISQVHGPYFVDREGQMICDNLCGTNRTKCGFNLQILPPQT